MSALTRQKVKSKYRNHIRLERASQEQYRMVKERAVIKFYAELGSSASETYQFMKQVYGDCCLSRSNVFMSHKRFLDGRDAVENDQRSGKPISSKTPEIIEKIPVFKFQRNDTKPFYCLSLGFSNTSPARLIARSVFNVACLGSKEKASQIVFGSHRFKTSIRT
ncbi:uncharacterized protein TNCV_4713081 [Trichonephila clavipes]|nr:uncharacterized protein TNCV_4713081 [Trichonephila clavipes]